MCNTTKLCYLILLCITEDEFANATMHDENVTFSVYLHKAVWTIKFFNKYFEVNSIDEILIHRQNQFKTRKEHLQKRQETLHERENTLKERIIR